MNGLMIAKIAQAVCSIGAAVLTITVGTLEKQRDDARMAEEIAKQVAIQMEKIKDQL